MQTASVDRNIRFLIIELFWAAIASAAYSFAAAYVIRLGGSNFIVSLITSAAAVVNMVTTIPFAAMMERTANRRPWLFRSLFIFRMMHIGLIFVPFLPYWRAEAVVVILLLANIPVAIFNTVWLPLFADIIPIHRRARLFSARNVTLGATMMAATYGFGRWLESDVGAFPGNYQILFTVALITSMLSTWYVTRMEIPDSPVDLTASTDRSIAGMWKLFTENRAYSSITINTLILNIAPWAAIALQPIYFVRVLNATDEWLGIWFAITNGGAILGNLFWPRLMEKYGFYRIMTIAAVISCAYYFAIGLVPNLTAILFFSLFIGMVNPGIDIAHFNILLQVSSPQRRALALGIFVTIMNFGLMVSSLIVSPMIDLIGAQALVIGLGVLRLIGGLLFVVNPVVRSDAHLTQPTQE
jgi:MFS family permease